jgi:hypothetical protein
MATVSRNPFFPSPKEARRARAASLDRWSVIFVMFDNYAKRGKPFGGLGTPLRRWRTSSMVSITLMAQLAGDMLAVVMSGAEEDKAMRQLVGFTVCSRMPAFSKA